jgi:hypothetical protein
MKRQCDPNGIRTRVTAVKGRCPGPLDDRVTKAGQYQNCCCLTQGKSPNCFQSFLFETAHPLTAAAADFGVTSSAMAIDWD